MKNKGYAKSWGTNRVHYGGCASCDLMKMMIKSGPRSEPCETPDVRARELDSTH